MRPEPEPKEPEAPATTLKLIPLDEAARALGVSRKWLRAHRRELRWVVELAPRVLRVDVEAMERWVARRRA